jgi:hypothetical protein
VPHPEFIRLPAIRDTPPPRRPMLSRRRAKIRIGREQVHDCDPERICSPSAIYRYGMTTIRSCPEVRFDVALMFYAQALASCTGKGHD